MYITVNLIRFMFLTFSNFLSLLRFPLAFFFLSQDPLYRCVAIVLAMLTDFFDGYLARRFKMTSQVGAFLDPLMDKFFVIFAAVILFSEKSLLLWEGLALISRDFAVFFFAFYLKLRGSWPYFKFRSIWSGKMTTTLQFFVLIALTYKIAIPLYIFWCFIILGVLAFLELIFIKPLA